MCISVSYTHLDVYKRQLHYYLPLHYTYLLGVFLTYFPIIDNFVTTVNRCHETTTKTTA